MTVRLRVDWIKCDGYGLCGDLVPDLIALDDWRYPILPADPIDGGRAHEVQRAIDCCPMRALMIERSAPRASWLARARRRAGIGSRPGRR